MHLLEKKNIFFFKCYFSDNFFLIKNKIFPFLKKYKLKNMRDNQFPQRKIKINKS